LARLRRQLGSDGDKFNIVFVSVDPAHDKRKDIASFLSMFDTPVIGLTGSPVQLAHIEKAYDVVVLKVPLDNGDYTIDHSSSVFLMGKRGEFVSTLDTQEPDATAVQKLRRLIAS
jgi:protein SCO1/2